MGNQLCDIKKCAFQEEDKQEPREGQQGITAVIWQAQEESKALAGVMGIVMEDRVRQEAEGMRCWNPAVLVTKRMKRGE